MKKQSIIFLLLISCLKFQAQEAIYRSLATQSYMNALLSTDTAAVNHRSAIERWTHEYGFSGQPDTVIIPVVFHLVATSGADMPTTEDLAAQLDALNRDFFEPRPLENPNPAELAEGFDELVAFPNIRFCLPTTDPTGAATDGIVQVFSTNQHWGISDSIKHTELGGSTAWNPVRYLNIWVSPLAGSQSGFAQMPGCAAATDGIVIDPHYFARSENYLSTVAGADTVWLPFMKEGRTLSHLVGNYLNLYDLWNDQSFCGDDYVEDTPIHNAPNFGKPGYKHVSTCEDNPVEMTMNIMDNTDDSERWMFTHGQVMRMHATLALGGPREGLRTSETVCTFSPSVGNITDRQANENGSDLSTLNIQVQPNPAKSGFSVFVLSNCEGQMTLEVFNSSGSRSYFDNHLVAKGETSIYIDSKNWSPGLYSVRVRCGKEEALQKVVIER